MTVSTPSTRTMGLRWKIAWEKNITNRWGLHLIIIHRLPIIENNRVALAIGCEREKLLSLHLTRTCLSGLRRRNTMRYCALVLTLIAVGYLATMACHKDVAQTTKSQPLDVPTVLRPVPAILNEDTLPPVAATEVKIKVNAGPFEFDRAQFVDENHGWAMSNNSIYRTTDGGNHWECLSQEPGQDAYFSSFCFVDEQSG